jgi:hypothetical protein
VGGTVKLANIHHVALICEKSSFVVVNVEMVWRREDRHDRRKTGCLGLAIHLVPGNLTFSTWACVIGIVVGSGEGACKLMRWRDSNGEALGEQKKTVTGGKVSQDMVCDIAPEQRYDTTGKRWPQRSEKDLGAYKKRQGCCSLLPDVGEMTRLAYAQYEVHAVEVLSEAGGGVVGTLEEEERHPAR